MGGEISVVAQPFRCNWQRKWRRADHPVCTEGTLTCCVGVVPMLIWYGFVDFRSRIYMTSLMLSGVNARARTSTDELEKWCTIAAISIEI